MINRRDFLRGSVGLAGVALVGCGGGPGVILPPTPPVLPRPQVREIAWYEISDRGDFWGSLGQHYVGEATRSSNSLALFNRGGYWQSALALAPRFKRATVFCDDYRDVVVMVQAAQAAGLKVEFVVDHDEPDLDGSTTCEGLNGRYRAFRDKLDEAGLQGVLVGVNLSLTTSHWKNLMANHECDFIANDGIYVGARDWLHSARPRLMEFFEWKRASVHAAKPAPFVLQAFSSHVLNPQQIDKEWMARQLRLLTPGGVSEWDFEGHRVRLEALPAWVIEQVPALWVYLMEPKPAGDDADEAGGNNKGVVDALVEWTQGQGQGQGQGQ